MKHRGSWFKWRALFYGKRKSGTVYLARREAVRRSFQAIIYKLAPEHSDWIMGKQRGSRNF